MPAILKLLQLTQGHIRKESGDAPPEKPHPHGG